ncbi:MAG: oligosaccharide flippase family protein [Sphaerospermopsis sp. SIO1G2]|nr:oligosaccharide flippase family protein [Sphaerospermopsis sp. SIO1G2]
MTQDSSATSESIGRSTVWSFIDSSGRQLLSLVFFLITIRFISQEAFGTIAIALLVIEFCKQIAIESIATSLTAQQRLEQSDYQASFLLILCTSLLCYGLVLISAPLLAHIFTNGALRDIVPALAPAILMHGVSRVQEIWLVKHAAFKSLAYRSLISVIIGGTVGVCLAVQGYGVIALAVQYVVIALISCLLLWRYTPWSPHGGGRLSEMCQIARNARYIIASSATIFTNSQSDIAFASYYLGDAATGVYNAAKRITLAINTMIVTSLNRVALPSFAKLETRAQIQHAYLGAISSTSFCTALLYGGASFTSPFLVEILLGDAWLEAAPIFSLLLINSYLTTVDQYNHMLLLTHKKSHWQTGLMLANMVASLIIFAIFARFGLLYLAMAFTVRALCFYPVATYLALKLTGLSFRQYFPHIAPSVASALCMSAGLYVSREAVIVDYAVVNIVLCSVLGLILYITAYLAIDRYGMQRIITQMRRSFG